MIGFSYFGVDRRAVLNFFNSFKTEQFVANYFSTILALRDHDQHSIRCFHSIYFILVFQSTLLFGLHVAPLPVWPRVLVFDVFDQSNNYPALFKLNISAILLMTAYMFHMLYVRIAHERSFALLYDYYVNGVTTFVNTPAVTLKKLVVGSLNFYQGMMLVTGTKFGRFCEINMH